MGNSLCEKKRRIECGIKISWKIYIKLWKTCLFLIGIRELDYRSNQIFNEFSNLIFWKLKILFPRLIFVYKNFLFLTPFLKHSVYHYIGDLIELELHCVRVIALFVSLKRFIQINKSSYYCCVLWNHWFYKCVKFFNI